MKKSLLILTSVSFLVACKGPEVPSEPPAMTVAPAVASDGFLTAYTEQSIPMRLPELRAFMEEQPLIGFLQPTGDISNPVDAMVLEGAWPQPGAVRWLRLADGHYVIERVIENDPAFFKYQVFVFTNSVGAGVEQIVGEQRFVEEGDSTNFEWTYNILPKNFVTRQFVRGNMDTIQSYIETGLEGFAEAARSATNP